MRRGVQRGAVQVQGGVALALPQLQQVLAHVHHTDAGSPQLLHRQLCNPTIHSQHGHCNMLAEPNQQISSTAEKSAIQAVAPQLITLHVSGPGRPLGWVGWPTLTKVAALSQQGRVSGGSRCRGQLLHDTHLHCLGQHQRCPAICGGAGAHAALNQHLLSSQAGVHALQQCSSPGIWLAAAVSVTCSCPLTTLTLRPASTVRAPGSSTSTSRYRSHSRCQPTLPWPRLGVSGLDMEADSLTDRDKEGCMEGSMEQHGVRYNKAHYITQI
ncbi:hypothetical protein HaLaN_18373 [Haematococcus lacustris]|uniref:Uncharacterized protein n=1 Tax=Haematococcus lacustris TaxID=44745 RepID=A0A699ZYL4_HAELA|nr:hypothetical protein HaLaN_18373 [Haematococcus lacustris]